MPTKDEIYRKFGEVSEAGQLLETELGNLLLEHNIVVEDLNKQRDPERATVIYKDVTKSTMGQLLRKLGQSGDSLKCSESLLDEALENRNRLVHHFFRQHNFRLNTEVGREIMLDDLQIIHNTIIDAYKNVLLVSGIDLENIVDESTPTDHLPI
jgi:hypothetical protein